MKRPFVFVNMASTVDGKITSAARERPAFASPADRRRMDVLRSTADALMVGAGTVRADNPTWHVRTRELRRADGVGLHRVLVSASANIPPESRFFDTRHGGLSILVTTTQAASAHTERVHPAAEVWRLGHDSVDLHAALAELSARGVERLLVEGGSELNWALFDLGCVDELFVTLSPALLGGSAAPTLLGGRGWEMSGQCRLQLLELDREGDELFCRYRIEGRSTQERT